MTHRSNILLVRIILPITVKPHHVEPGARSVAAILTPPTAAIPSTLLRPDSRDVVLQLEGHRGVVGDLVHGVGVGPPVVDLVHLQQYTGLAMAVPAHIDIITFCCTFVSIF